MRLVKMTMLVAVILLGPAMVLAAETTDGPKCPYMKAQANAEQTKAPCCAKDKPACAEDKAACCDKAKAACADKSACSQPAKQCDKAQGSSCKVNSDAKAQAK